MKSKICPSLATILSIMVIAGCCEAATFQIVNIDFNGLRPGDAGDAGTYVGASAAGTGTVFNGITADSTGGDDNLAISISGLLDEMGTITTVSFEISPVGGDHEPSQPFSPPSLYDDYVFNNSAGNTVGAAGSPFVIGGLGDATIVDLYFYLNGFNVGTIELTGFAGTGVAGTYNDLGATAFLGVPVSGGSVTGVLGSNGATSVLGGLTIVSNVPEPGTFAMVCLWTFGFMLRRKRRQ